MKNLKILLITLFFLASFIFSYSVADAEEVGEVKADVSVSATVPSQVCGQYSSITSNITEILADASQKITLTVVVKDCNNSPLSNKVVTITSNRGALDTIKSVSSNGDVLASGNGLGVTGQTDVNGFAFFQVYSRVPGKTIISTNVDIVINLDNITLTFLTLPFPKYVSVGVQVPKVINPNGEITIFKPSQTGDVTDDDIVTLGVKVVIPFWVVVLQIIMMTITPILFIVILILIKRIKYLSETELAKIEQTEQLVAREEQEIQNIATKEDNDQNLPPTITGQI